MTFDAANRLATFNGQTITHDLDGNMLAGPLPATGAMGNYTYDSRNRLTGAGGFAYRYNAEGNRVGLTSANEPKFGS
jgi:YD repeat-containing protein